MVGWLLNQIEQGDKYMKSQIKKYFSFIRKLAFVKPSMYPQFFRSQSLNQADALEKLRNAIRLATQPDKPLSTAEEVEKFRKWFNLNKNIQN